MLHRFLQLQKGHFRKVKHVKHSYGQRGQSSFKITTVVISTFLTMTESLLTNNNLKKRIPPFSKVVGRFYFFQHIRTYCIENWQQGPISAQSAFFLTNSCFTVHTLNAEAGRPVAGCMRCRHEAAPGCMCLAALQDFKHNKPTPQGPMHHVGTRGQINLRQSPIFSDNNNQMSGTSLQYFKCVWMYM